jgi:type IV pilus assembly protein PilX
MIRRFDPARRRPSRSSRRQRGAALIVALILLVIVTLLALSNLQTVALEEKMTGATYDRQLAFQAAEAALREAEQYVETNKPIASYTDGGSTCPGASVINNCDPTTGLCPPPDKDCTPRWQYSNFNGWKNATVSLPALAGTPQYFIEYLGNTFPCSDGEASDPMNCKRYRITARSNPGAGRASVMLQSVYRTN